VQYRLLAPGEELATLLKLPPEETLLRWINFHLEKVRWRGRTGFGDTSSGLPG
jgi:plastin-1